MNDTTGREIKKEFQTFGRASSSNHNLIWQMPFSERKSMIDAIIESARHDESDLNDEELDSETNPRNFNVRSISIVLMHRLNQNNLTKSPSMLS